MVRHHLPGVSGVAKIGNQFVAKSKRVGHTLPMACSGCPVANPGLFTKAGWDPIKVFGPVAMLTRASKLLVTHTAAAGG